MPTIIAICPYCREGGVRAPESAVGVSATCPRCRSNFTVVPSEGAPGWSTSLPSSPAQSTVPSPEPYPGSAETLSNAETSSSAAWGHADTTEPSPVLRERHSRSRPSSSTLPPSSSLTSASPQAEEGDSGRAPVETAFVFALISAILVGPAALATQLPYGRFVSLAVAAIGAFTGLLTLGAEGRARWLGAAGSGLHFLLILLVLLAPEWFRLDPQGAYRQPGFSGPVMLDHATQRRTPLEPQQWLDAAQVSWEYQDLRVTVTNAAIAPVELRGPQSTRRKTQEAYLHLTVQVTHVGMERLIDLSQWAVGEASGVTLREPSGKALAVAQWPPGWSVERGRPSRRLMPGLASHVHLLFAAPTASAGPLQLELAGAALGWPEETIRFRISPQNSLSPLGGLPASGGVIAPLPQPPGGGFAFPPAGR